ncbi:MAG: glutamate--tRNA ligase [Cyanobacteria bacterium SIG30]|nr:glutamate--tRNA ligase [Cyanobacteria bacterium SIG30]
MTETRVRIAPSPSGNLHVGTARTALFNYLYAKKNNGKFILRIEDTDAERTSQEYIDNIFDSLKALGLNWDEGPDVGGEYGPYTQSERFDLYPKYAQILLEKGFAYECYCTPEELEAEKELATQNKQAYVYSKKCENLTDDDKAKLKAEGRLPAIRFSISKAQKAFHENNILAFDDMVKGNLQQDTDLIGDFVIMKSNGTPTYNFAVVIDDMLMKISHIIRGEDHISNTFKQILIYEALGAEVPRFGHLGMILAPDRSKLSKRHGATAVSEFVEKGYLTDALVNFVALLGWSPSDSEEIKTVDEIAQDFEISKISSSNSIFEYDKLNWMNGQYIKKMPVEELYDYILPFLKKYDISKYTKAQLLRLIEITREPLTILSEIEYDAQYFFEKPDLTEVQEILDTEVSKNVLSYVLDVINSWGFDSEEKIHDDLAQLREHFKAQGIKPKETMWALRSALTGRTRGADMAALVCLLGKDEIIERIKKVL